MPERAARLKDKMATLNEEADQHPPFISQHNGNKCFLKGGLSKVSTKIHDPYLIPLPWHQKLHVQNLHGMRFCELSKVGVGKAHENRFHL